MHCSGTRSGLHTVSAYNTVASALAALFVCVWASGCGTTDPEVERPARPKWECPTPAYSPVERGTGVKPGSPSIVLRWYIGDDADLKGYQVYARTGTQAADTLIASRPLTEDELDDRGAVIERTDPRRVIGEQPTYYVLFAYTQDSVRSHRSDTTGFMVLSIPRLKGPDPGAVIHDPVPQFTFHPAVGSPNATTYVVRVRADSTSKRVLWVSSRRAITGLTWQEIQFIRYGIVGDEGYLVRPELPPGRYEWRVDFLGTHRLLNPVEAAPCRCLSGKYGCADDGLDHPSLGDLDFARSASTWRKFVVAPR